MTDPIPPVVFFDLGNTLVNSSSNTRYPDALDVLQVLYERGYRLGLLSNQAAGTTINQVYQKLAGFNLDTYIEPGLITISSELPGNTGKPNQQIFDLALQKAGQPVAGDNSIFVTEEFPHIQAARSFGWRAILIRNTGCQSGDGECVTGLSQLLDRLPSLGDTDGTNLHLAPPSLKSRRSLGGSR